MGPESVANPSLFAQVAPRGSVLYVKLVGPSIGQREVGIITDQVSPEIARLGAAMKHLVIETSQVTFMNSMGLGMLINFRNLANKAGAKTVIMGMNGELLNLFKMVKVDRLYTMVKDQAELTKVIGA